jgi:ornithine carbamoyltransferase
MRSFAPQGRSLCFYGDAANNVAISLALTGSRLGYDMTFCSPENYRLPEWVVDEIENDAEAQGSSITIESDPHKAIKGCDFLYTDVWISMGQEGETETRQRDLYPYALSRDLLARTDKEPYVMHCLPAKWGNEMNADLKDYHRNIIFDQAENRLHMQKSVLLALLGA